MKFSLTYNVRGNSVAVSDIPVEISAKELRQIVNDVTAKVCEAFEVDYRVPAVASALSSTPEQAKPTEPAKPAINLDALPTEPAKPSINLDALLGPSVSTFVPAPSLAVVASIAPVGGPLNQTPSTSNPFDAVAGLLCDSKTETAVNTEPTAQAPTIGASLAELASLTTAIGAPANTATTQATAIGASGSATTQAAVASVPADSATKPSTILPSSEYTYDPFVEGKKCIPEESEVQIGNTVFGVEIEWPPIDQITQPITTTNRDETNGGQMQALNTVLSINGIKGSDRHNAVETILAEYGEIHGYPTTENVNSLKDLRMADASVCLTFFARATDNQIEALKIAMGGVSEACLI